MLPIEEIFPMMSKLGNLEICFYGKDKKSDHSWEEINKGSIRPKGKKGERISFATLSSLNWKQPMQGVQAVVTRTKCLWLAIHAADCPVLIIFDEKMNILSLVHASRAALSSRIVERTVKFMEKPNRISRKNFLVEVSPYICPQCYGFDLWAEIKDQLTGIPSKNISNPGLCTLCDLRFYSYVEQGRPKKGLLSNFLAVRMK